MRAARVRNQLGLTWSGELILIEGCDVSDATLLKILNERQVEFATGNSDAESVRDFESGPGNVRWSKRSPYWFRREMNANEVRWRRKVKPVRGPWVRRYVVAAGVRERW